MTSTTFPKKDQTNETLERAKDVASSVGSKIKDVASNVGTAIGHGAENATAAVGSGMASLGEKIREKGPEKGVLGTVTGKVADALEGTGKYLEEKNLSGMAADVTDLVRKHPVPAMLIGIGIGLLLSRFFRG